MTDPEARARVYGMPYKDWQAKYQKEASAEQKRRFEETKPLHAEIGGHK